MSSPNLDLSGNKLELERLFSSIIGKIPDLCHPAAPILEREDDFFNRTRDLKLVPFKKQEVFERCVTPTLDERRHELVSSPTGVAIDIPTPSTRASGSSAPSHGRSSKPTEPSAGRAIETNDDSRGDSPAASGQHQRAPKVSFKGATGGRASSRVAADQTRSTESRVGLKRTTTQCKLGDTKQSRISDETREKLALRNRIREQYSRLKVARRASSATSSADGAGEKPELDCPLNKIFADVPRESSRRASAGKTKQQAARRYPFANPMPECMLTKERLGNLREIIVSSASDIEWHMLTPIRPASEYEEIFFDKLVELHRSHHRYQVSESSRLASLRLQQHRHQHEHEAVGGGSGSGSSSAGLDAQRGLEQQVAAAASVGGALGGSGGPPRFRHTRHGTVQLPQHQQWQTKPATSKPQQRHKQPMSMSMGMKLTGRLHLHSKSGDIAAGANLRIPRLILTADEGHENVDDYEDDDRES